MHTARTERERRIKDDKEKRLRGEKRESLFDEALNCLKSDRKINGVLPSGRARHVIVVREIYESFPLYPTGCSPVELKKRQERYPDMIFIPVGLDEPVGELTKKILSAIDGNGRNSN